MTCIITFKKSFVIDYKKLNNSHEKYFFHIDNFLSLVNLCYNAYGDIMDQLFLERMNSLLEDDYDDFINSLSDDPYKGFYINTRKKDVLEHLDKNYIKKHPYVENGYYFDYKHYPLGKLPYYLCGLYYIQEPSAMLVSELLDVKEDDYVLDMCGAPGGKSCAIACRLSDEGLLITNDINTSRAKILCENIERFGLSNTFVTNSDPLLFTKHFKGFFDKIVLDAPCSGEGMFRKEEKAIETWSYNKVKECAHIQRQLIGAAYELLVPGGELIYSTCTYSLEENEEIIQYALDHFNFELIDLPKHKDMSTGVHMSETIRLYPHQYKGEGHFIAKLKKLDGSIPKVKLLKSNISRNNLNIIKDFYKENLNIKVPPYLYENNNHIYSIHSHFPDMSNIKVLRTGLYLGECRKNRFIPSHSLALSLNKGDSLRSYDYKVDSEEIKAYINGQTLTGNNQKGYGLILVDGYPLSFYKESNNQIKNLFPKGLRR